MAIEAETSRRAFLRQAAPAALGLLTRGLSATDDPPPAPSAGELLRLGRRAMGCRFEVILPAAGANTEAARDALDLVDALEQQMTIYREDSELNAINRAAASAPAPVEPRLFALLQLAARLSEETGGAFDITAGPLARLWRECRAGGTPPRPEEIGEAVSRVGMDRVRLDAASRTVAFGRDGMQLDLASIGKGYAVDRAAELLAARGVRAALVHGGHSSVRAIGRPPWDKAWVLDIEDPLRPGGKLATLHLRDQAMATSAHAEGHLLDPRTGWPAQGPLGATVLAPTAAEADALATAFCVMSADEAQAYCRRHPEVRALLAVGDLPTSHGRDARATEVRPAVIGLSDDEVEVAR